MAFSIPSIRKRSPETASKNIVNKKSFEFSEEAKTPKP
jgi:hypothetical protein